jgi:hypothetical protein
MDEEKLKQDIIEAKADVRMNTLKVQALIDLLVREGVISSDELDEHLGSLQEKGG